MIEIRHLKLVATLERVGTLSEAAKELHLTQSALSHQLKQLETHLQTPLFHRINNQLRFTAAGRAFCAECAPILAELEQLETHVKALQHDPLRDYVHGYSPEETQRLHDQATSIADFLHWDSRWPAGTTVLEAGCGVGAQTRLLAPKNPDVNFVGVDLVQASLDTAQALAKTAGLTNVQFIQADLRQLPYPPAFFDHVFVCFVLEHLSEPARVLAELRRVLKPGGTITVIEGDHGSTYFHPDSAPAREAVAAQVTLQQRNGGNANIGRQLYPLLDRAGFAEVQVSPRQIYVDDSKPALVEGFIRNTFTAMIKGIATEAVAQKIIPNETMQRGIRDLYRTAEGGGSFCYTFFKAVGYKVS